jgi:GT2 family glycosyltransferase
VTAAPEVAVIIASHSRPGPLARVLASVEAQRRDVALEVIVADNASPMSEEVASVAAGFPGVTLVRLAGNLGFGRALNRGIARASAPYLYLGCDDVVLGDGCLRELYAAHRRRPAPGLTAPVIYVADKPDEVRCAGGTHTLGLTPRLVLHREIPPPAADGTCPVTFIPGGTIFTERCFLLELGGYREDFFMYDEDTELCQRVRRRQRDLVIVPPARVFDLIAPGTYDPTRVRAEQLRNYLAMITLHARAGLAGPIVAKQFASGLIRLPSLTRQGRREWRAGWWRYLSGLPLLLRDRLRSRPPAAPPRRRTAPPPAGAESPGPAESLELFRP